MIFYLLLSFAFFTLSHTPCSVSWLDILLTPNLPQLTLNLSLSRNKHLIRSAMTVMWCGCSGLPGLCLTHSLIFRCVNTVPNPTQNLPHTSSPQHSKYSSSLLVLLSCFPLFASVCCKAVQCLIHRVMRLPSWTPRTVWRSAASNRLMYSQRFVCCLSD